MSKHSPRRRRSNPSGGEAAMKGARLGGKALVGALVTLLADRVVGGMKKADGTARFTAGQRTAVTAGLAAGAALGASFVDNDLVSDALEGTAVVAGGSAAIQYAVAQRLPERVQALIPGQPAATPPAAGLFADPRSFNPAAGLYAQPSSYAGN